MGQIVNKTLQKYLQNNIAYQRVMLLLVRCPSLMTSLSRSTKSIIFYSGPGLGLDEEVDPVEAVTRFLDTLEAEALLHLDTLITDQEAQDRVLLEDVQVTGHSQNAHVLC